MISQNFLLNLCILKDAQTIIFSKNTLLAGCVIVKIRIEKFF